MAAAVLVLSGTDAAPRAAPLPGATTTAGSPAPAPGTEVPRPAATAPPTVTPTSGCTTPASGDVMACVTRDPLPLEDLEALLATPAGRRPSYRTARPATGP